MATTLITIELQIEPEIIMHGQADKLAPGVVYHPEYYGIAPFEHLPDIGEVIAYGINEGHVTQDTVELTTALACIDNRGKPKGDHSERSTPA